MRLPALLLMVLAGTGVPVRAHGQAGHPAARVAGDFFESLWRGEWRQAASLVDLSGFSMYLDAVLQPRPPVPPLTVEQYLRHDPDMPREVAEYQVRKFNESQVHAARRMGMEFAGIDSSAQLARLAPHEAMARWLEARDPTYQLQRWLAERECDTTAVSVAARDLRMRRRVLGAVEETPERAWVVFVTGFGDEPLTGAKRDHPDAKVIPFRLTAAGWRLDWNQFVEGMLFTGGLAGIDCPRRR